MSFVGSYFAPAHVRKALVVCPYERDATGGYRCHEFVSLCEAAELDVLGVYSGAVRAPSPATYFRSGSVSRFRAEVAELGAEVVAVDHELTPAQQRNLEREIGTAVLDRSAVILIIFGRRATSAAGKLQVELAQAEYLMPRLVGLWQHFDRERGGVGVRGGAGEKQIEVDRRLLRQRMAALRRDISEVERTRNLHRAKRRRGPLLQAAVVGYTNVGKSTLLRELSRQSVLVRDMPFATLDPLTRRIEIGPGEAFLLTDTVGFVQDLPHTLVAAFRSTLEEAALADVLIHVVDASAPDPRLQIETTRQVLDDIGASHLPCLYVLNKMDAVRSPEAVISDLAHFQPRVAASFLRGEGIDVVVDWIRYHIRRHASTVRIRIPLTEGDAVQAAERASLGAGRWSSDTVEYDVPAGSELAARWSIEAQ